MQDRRKLTHHRRQASWPALLVPLAFAFMLLAVSCGGDDGSPLAVVTQPRWDVERADELAHAALITSADLGKGDWDVTDDDFSETDYPDNAVCAPLVAFRQDAKAGVAGKANRVLTSTGSGDATFPVNVAVEVQVHRDAAVLATLVERQAKLVSEGKLTACLDSYVHEVFDPDITKLDVKPALLGRTPKGAVSYGFDLQISLPSYNERLPTTQVQGLRAEYYNIRLGNAILVVGINGSSDLLTAEFVNEVLDKAQAKAINAAKGEKPGAAATPATKDATTTGTQTASLDALRSYRYTAVLQGTGTGGPMADLAESLSDLPGAPGLGPNGEFKMSFKGAYVAPNRAEWTMTIDSFQLGQTVIKDEEWTVFAGEVDGPNTATSTTHAELSAVAAIWDETFASSVAGTLTCSKGTSLVNAVQARSCTAGTEAMKDVALGEFFGDVDLGTISSSELKVALADAGNYPVRLRLAIAGQDSRRRKYTMTVDFDISDINKSIVISPPVAAR